MDKFESIRRQYGVPVTEGVRVLYKHNNREGEIVGTQGSYLMIRLDGDDNARPYHPTWKLEFLSTPSLNIVCSTSIES